MRGSGIGSIFSNIFRGIIPLASKAVNIGRKVISSPTGQKIMKAAKRTAIDAGLDIATDVLQGKNVKEAAKSNLKTVGTRFLDNASKEFETAGGKKKKSSPPKPKKAKSTKGKKKTKGAKKKTKGAKKNKKKSDGSGKKPKVTRGKKATKGKKSGKTKTKVKKKQLSLIGQKKLKLAGKKTAADLLKLWL